MPSNNNSMLLEQPLSKSERSDSTRANVRVRLESELETSAKDSAGFSTEDPYGLIRDLEASGRFHRDSGLGRLFHPGKISFRETKPTDALHILIDHNQVSAHIDRHSPLSFKGGRSKYSLAAMAIHNLSGMADDFRRMLQGSRGEHRCRLERETLKLDEKMLAWLRQGPRGDVLTGVGSGTGQAPWSPEGDRTRTIPFSVIDEAVTLLDSESAPCSIQLEVRVAGHLDEARLKKALVQALRRHPMARVRKIGSRRTMHRDFWEIRPGLDVDPLKVIHCPDDRALQAARSQLQSLAVPLAESPPLRVRLARNPDGDVLMINANHAATDGLGVLRIMNSIARAYAGQSDPLPQLDFSAARDLPERLAAAGPSHKLRRWLALADKLRDLFGAPARLVADQESEKPGYGFHLEQLSAKQTRRITEMQHQGTDCDVLVAALHLAIADWNAEHGQPCERIGVLMPANMRPARWRHEMVGNFSLPARISTGVSDRIDLASALRAVTLQTKRKNRSGMGTALIEVLKASRWLPLWAKQASVALLPITGNRLVDTATISSLGTLENPPYFGSDAGETTEVWFSLPARMPLGLSLGTSCVAGKLHLAFRYRHRLFGAEAARHFAECYLHKLEELSQMETTLVLAASGEG